MKKQMRYIVLLVALLLTFQIPASANSLQDNLVPQDSNKGSVGEVELKYNEFPQHHYKLDTYVNTEGDWMPWNWADGAGKQIYIAMMEIINSIWNVNILLANFTMKIVEEAFQLDFVSNVTEEIGSAIQNIAGFGPGGFMAGGLWPLLVTFIIAIVGAWATYVGMVKRESSRAWGGLISSVTIFIFALGFFSNAPAILKGINDWSSDLQSDVLAVSASVVNPGASYSKEEGIATVRNQMFDLMVKKPYLLMQYGTTQIEEDRANDMLSLDPFTNSEGRQEKAKQEVDDQDNTMMSIDGISQRAGFVPLLFIANSIIGIFLLVVSGTIILYQMVFLALVLFAPVPLLIALVPRWKHAAFDWGMKVLHAQLMKISIALLLTILFGISAILYRATENSDLGYLGAMLLQIICFVGVWAKRKELFNIVSTAVNNVESSTGATLQNYRQKFNQARSLARNAKNGLDENKGKGRIRNQPLTERRQASQNKAGALAKEQLADRRKQLKQANGGLNKTNTELAAGAIGVVVADREGFSDSTEDDGKSKNHAGVGNASTDREQLMDRTNGSQSKPQNGSITTIDDLRRRRMGNGNLPLTDRQSIIDARNEVATSLERPDVEDTDVSERTQSERNVNLTNRNRHEDNINVQHHDRLVERRTTDRQRENDSSHHETTHERHATESVKRKVENTDHNERSIKNVTDRNTVQTETHHRSQESFTNRETHSREVHKRNEVQEDVTERIEEMIRRGKHITQWEAQQQINQRKPKRDSDGRNEQGE